MVPGNGIIVRVDRNAASGASVAGYTLGGYSTSAVTQPSSWTVTDAKVHSSSCALHSISKASQAQLRS